MIDIIGDHIALLFFVMFGSLFYLFVACCVAVYFAEMPSLPSPRLPTRLTATLFLMFLVGIYAAAIAMIVSASLIVVYYWPPMLT